VRRGSSSRDALVVVCNFTPVLRQGYRLGVPSAGSYEEVFNSDSAWYGGSNTGNGGGLQSSPQPHHGREHSLTLTLPPLAVVVLKQR
jgi:1,4-alpha-glucan branching enzyme